MIRMISGAFGLRLPNGIIRRKTAQDGPFEAQADVEARLVASGVAVYVTDVDAPDNDTAAQSIVAPADYAELPPGVPDYGYDMTRAQLAQLLDDAEIDYPVGATKSDMILLLDNYYRN